MDTHLATNMPGASLSFRALTRFSDDSGYATVLAVESEPFAGSIPFSFQPHSLKVFLGELRTLNETLRGTATLKPIWERQFVCLRSDGRGHVIVAGELEFEDQQLRFAFETDQTCLAPLIRDVEAWPRIAAQ